MGTMRKNERVNFINEASDTIDISPEEIKKWSDDISNAQGQDAKKKLRVAFKNKFGVNYSQDLAKKILDKEVQNIKSTDKQAKVAVSPEITPEITPEVVESAAINTSNKLDDIVVAQENIEKEEIKAVVGANPEQELIVETGKIDAEREKKLAETKKRLGLVLEKDLKPKPERWKPKLVLKNRPNNRPGGKDDNSKIKPKPETKIEPETKVELSKNEPGTNNPEKETPTTPAPELAPEKAPKPETPEETVLKKFKDFNISEDDIKNIKGFSSLTLAQQALVYDGLKQMAFVDVKEKAKADFNNELKEKGRFGKMIKGFLRKYDIAKSEKENIQEIKQGGLSLHQSNLEELTSMISAMKIDATLDSGKLKVNYLQVKEDLDEKQKEILTEFNDVANRFSKIPQEWSLKTSSQKEYGEYVYLSALYEKNKADALEVLRAGNLDKEALLEMNKVDYQVKMMQFMSAHPELDKEFSKLENQSALKKIILGEASVRGSYMVSGFIVRQTLAGLISFGGLSVAAASFAAAPLAAAGFGALRGRNIAQFNLNERDIAGRKTDAGQQITQIEMARKKSVQSLKELVPAEYALNPEEWLKTIASEEEKKKYKELRHDYEAVMHIYQEKNEQDRDKTEKHFYEADSLTAKLKLLLAKTNLLQEDELKNNLQSLEVRARFIEENLKNGLINFGASGALTTKLDLVQALSEARTQLALNSELLEKQELPVGLSDEEKKKLEELDLQKDLENRFERLFRSQYFDFYNSLNNARKKHIRKEMIKGAGIGATFAIAGALIRDLAVHFGFLGSTSGTNVRHNVSGNASEHVDASLKSIKPAIAEQTDALVNDSTKLSAGERIDTLVNKSNGFTEINNQAAIIEKPVSAEIFSNEISNANLGGRSDSVWHSTKEIFAGNAEKLGYQGDIHDSTALDKWAEIQTNNAISHSSNIPDKVFEGNNVLLEKNSDGNFIVKVEAGEGAEPGVLETAPAVEEEKIIIEEKNIISEAPRNDTIPKEIINKINFSSVKTPKLDPHDLNLTGHILGQNQTGDIVADTLVGQTIHHGPDLIQDNQLSGSEISHPLNNVDQNTAVANNTAVNNSHNIEGGNSDIKTTMPNNPPSIEQAMSAGEADSSMTLEKVLSSNKGEAVDKVLLEFAREKGVGANTTVKQLLDTYPGLSAQMQYNPENSVYAYLYDLRLAGAEQTKMLNEHLQSTLETLSEEAKNKFNVLLSRNAFQVAKDLKGEPVLALKFGAFEKTCEFSADGLKELIEFSKFLVEKK